MNLVLVDSSVWISHFRETNAELSSLLALDRIRVHPMVLGELACGTPPSREQTLSYLARLQAPQQASMREVLSFVERERLYGLGCGLIDLTLLASTLITPGLALWTTDKRLGALAERFGARYRPAVH